MLGWLLLRRKAETPVFFAGADGPLSGFAKWGGMPEEEKTHAAHWRSPELRFHIRSLSTRQLREPLRSWLLCARAEAYKKTH